VDERALRTRQNHLAGLTAGEGAPTRRYVRATTGGEREINCSVARSPRRHRRLIQVIP
jgi:hypothetical protein